MKLVVHSSTQEFLDVARDFLVAREAEHNLMLGIAATLVENPERFGNTPPFFATVHDVDDAVHATSTNVVAGASRTPPHQL